MARGTLTQNGAPAKLNRVFAFGLGLTAFALSTITFGQEQILAKKDYWTLRQINLPDGAVVCSADAGRKEKKASYALEVRKYKNTHHPIEIIMHEKGEPQVGSIMKTGIGNEAALFHLMAKGQSTASYWMLPDEMQLVETELRKNKEFVVKPLFKSKIKEVKFNAKGAGTILSEMQHHCNQGLPLVNPRFAAFTDHSQIFDANPIALSMDQVTSLRTGFFAMSDEFKKLTEAEGILASIIDRYSPVVDESRRLTIERLNLSGTTIPALERDRAVRKDLLTQSVRRLGELTKNIPASQKVLTSSQRSYDLALSLAGPLIPEHRNLSAFVERTLSDLNESKTRLAQVRNEILAIDQTLYDFDIEAGNLTQKIQDLRAILRDKKQALGHTESTLKAFDPDTIKAARIERHPKHQQISERLRGLRARFTVEVKQLPGLQKVKTEAAEALAKCKEDPAADCTTAKAALDASSKQVADTEASMASLRTLIDRDDKEIAAIEREISQDVNERHRALRLNYEQASREHQDIVERTQSATARRRDLLEIEIPRLQARSRYLLGLKKDFERTVVSDQADHDLAIQNLQAFENRTNFLQLKADLDSSEDSLSDATSQFNGLVAEKSAMESQKIDSEARLIRIAADLESTSERIRTITSRLSVLDIEIAKFNQERAPVDRLIGQLGQAIDTLRADYMATLGL